MARLDLGLSSKVVEDSRTPCMSLQVRQILRMRHLLKLIWPAVMLFMPASHSATQLDRAL